MSRATYAELGDACATAHAMELIGERWTYPILRELMLGPKRFGELVTSVRGITPTMLTVRLRDLERVGLVSPSTLPPPANLGVYDLTGWARELAPILRALGKWAQASPVRTGEGGLTPDAAVQAMTTMAGDRLPDRDTRLELHLVDSRVDPQVEHLYRIAWSGAGLLAERGVAIAGGCVVRCDSTAWAEVLFDGRSLDEVGATVTGERSTAQRLVDQFRSAAGARPTASTPQL